MDITTLAILISPHNVWIAVAVISIWMVLMCLKIIGNSYYTAVSWHNLKVQAHDLRLDHLRDLKALRADNLSKEARKHKGLSDLAPEDATEADSPSTPQDAPSAQAA